MIVKAWKNRKPFSRKLALFGAIGALLVSLPELIYGNDFGAFLVAAIAFVIMSLTVLIVALAYLRRRYMSALGMLAIYCSLLWTFHSIAPDTRTRFRWLFEARDYKHQIEVLANPTSGGLKHVEWDGWGFAGAGDTTVYLVLDPSDTLSTAAQGRSHEKLAGLPCEVARVRRLEKRWYTVQFYTDTSWDYCGDTEPNSGKAGI